MNFGIKEIAGMLVASAACFSVAGGAQAQSKTNVKASGWFKTCNEQQGSKICNVQFQVVTNSGQVVTSVSLIEITGNVNRKLFQIVVPTARSLPPGVEVKVDNKQATAIPYSFCRPAFCVAEASLNDQLVSILKAGGQLDITSINFQGTANPVPVTLKGFTAAYDGEPVKPQENNAPSAEETDEEKLKKQLEEKLKSGQN